MAVIVVDETEFGIVVLTAPLDSLLHITCGGYLPVGGVGIGGADVAGGAVELADVLRQIPAVGVPGAVLLDSQRAGGYGLRRGPGDIPQRGVVAAGEVDAGHLQIAAVDVALLKRDIIADGDHLGGAAAHVVVLTMHGGNGAVCRLAGEVRGAVLSVVADGPDAGGSLHAGLVAIRIVLRLEVDVATHRECGVLVEVISHIPRATCHAGAVFDSGGAVADIIVVVSVGAVVDGGGGEFAAVIIAEFRGRSVRPRRIKL